MTRIDFIENARSIHGYRYEYLSLPDILRWNHQIQILFNDKIFTQRINKHLMGRCPEKNIPRKTTTQFISESRKIWGNKYDYSLCRYDGALKKVKIIYDGIIFDQVAISHLRKMAPEENMNLEYFIKKSRDKWGDKYDYSKVQYITAHTKVDIIYNGMMYSQSPTRHLISAPEKLNLRKTTDQFIKESNLIHDNKFSYQKTKYVKNQKKVTITCPIHGDFEQIPLSHIQGSGCGRCNESKGEKQIEKFLKCNNITYDRQHKFSDCKNILELPFDFYIPSTRTLIEFDGKQHFEPMSFFGGLDAYEKLKINDKIKSDYCEENYINLIRIRYDQENQIDEILKNNLRSKN